MQTVVGLAGLSVSFALMYPMLLAKVSLSLASPYAKAESRRRLYAATIGGLLVASILALYWSSASIACPTRTGPTGIPQTILRASEHNVNQPGRRTLATSPGCGHSHSDDLSRETFIRPTCVVIVDWASELQPAAR
jgi:hypothetical protein